MKLISQPKTDEVPFEAYLDDDIADTRLQTRVLATFEAEKLIYDGVWNDLVNLLLIDDINLS